MRGVRKRDDGDEEDDEDVVLVDLSHFASRLKARSPRIQNNCLSQDGKTELSHREQRSTYVGVWCILGLQVMLFFGYWQMFSRREDP